MDPDLVAKSLCFHGQPLQKIWEGERGNHDLHRLGIANPDYSIYILRQKNLTFHDRAKRLKLHQFIARKATVLFNSNINDDQGQVKYKEKIPPGAVTIMPPFEAFLHKNIDKNLHMHKVLGNIKQGDIIYAMVTQKSSTGILVKPLCTGEPLQRYLADITTKAYVLAQNLVSALDKRGNQKPYTNNDYVCCEVIEISIDANRINLGMKGAYTTDSKAPLGLINAEQLPEYYKKTIENQGYSFTELLENSDTFNNPEIENLFQEVGLSFGVVYSNMNSLTRPFPQQEYAHELRQIQASKWAYRSVADGIENFKEGKQTEAFQCLNKALSIDPRNVEGLVARGALYANSGAFKKAVDDFEIALKINPYHANARKYMGETLVALGRSYEEENRLDDARKAYKDCLAIIPHHEEAKSSLEFLNGKSGNQMKQLIDTNELLSSCNFKIEASSSMRDAGTPPPQLSTKIHKTDDSSKKSSKKKNKRRGSSSSDDDLSDSSSSSTSSSSTSKSSSSSDSNSSASNKCKSKRSHDSKQKSLSPLSKRMAIMGEANPTSSTRYQFNQPFHLANSGTSSSITTSNIISSDNDNYDAKVRNFLEMTRDEDDYESRVRNLVEEVSKYRKERKTSSSGKKKKEKEKKKQKRMKKDSKKSKKKKEKEREKPKEKENSKNLLEQIDNMELKEALQIVKSMPMLEFESKLSADLKKFEKSFEDISHRGATSKATKEHFRENSESPPRDNSRGRKTSPIPSSSRMEVKKQLSPPKPPSFPKISFPIVDPKKPAIPKAPVVLDKFGCFRLAVPIETNFPKRSSSSLSPRRNRSRSRSSRRSRSPRRRRRSPSRRRRRSRSRSRSRRSSRSRPRSPRRRRSISRSRSRSRSPFWHGGRGGYKGRNFIPNFRGRGRGRGGYRGYRPDRSPYFRRSRSWTRSPIENRRSNDRSPRRGSKGKDSRGIEGKWTHDRYEKHDPMDDPTIEEIDKIINKAQKERKEEILQRDRDLLKKPVPTNLPF